MNLAEAPGAKSGYADGQSYTGLFMGSRHSQCGLDIGNRILHGSHLSDIVVGNRDAEFILDHHDDLDQVDCLRPDRR